MITLSREYWTEPPSVSVLAAAVRRHRAEVPRYQRLRRYFAGRNDKILCRGEEGLPHPIARYIALMSSGYLTGRPVRYEAEGQEEALKEMEAMLSLSASDSVRQGGRAGVHRARRPAPHRRPVPGGGLRGV